MSKSSLEHTAHYWDTLESWQGWTRIPAVSSRLNAKVSGNPDIDWYTYTVNTYLSGQLPVARCLSLGCGEGWLERRLAALGVFATCDAYDMSPGSIDKARRLAADQGFGHINYVIADINYLKLPNQVYDVVWVNSAIHHIEQLEHLCGQIRSGLKPEGLLVLNEYVGPSRFQFSTRQREVIQAAFALLPHRYRRLTVRRAAEISARSPMRQGLRWTIARLWNKLQDGDLLPALHRRREAWQAARSGEAGRLTTVSFPTARDVAAADPSEAIRSAEIMRVIPDFFAIVERKDLGGALLQFLLDGITDHFFSDDSDTRCWLDLLFQIEDALLACGDLQSDFVYVVARPRGEREG